MRFALVGPTIEENLSIAYLAAALRRAGHAAELVPYATERSRSSVVRRVLESRPDVVGLSMTFQARARGFLTLAAELRRAGFAGRIVGGGHWASLAAREILRDHPAVDLILRGEAERSIVLLAEALQHDGPLADVPGIVLRDERGAVREGTVPPQRLDVDDFPPPARDEPPLRHLGIPWAPLLASRGCRGSCSFCSIAAFHRLGTGPVRRLRAPECVADEMAALWRDRGVRIFMFHDDDFFCGRHADDLARIDRLGEALAARGVPPAALVLKARPDDLREDVVRRLRRLGLVRVFLGIENDSPAGLRALDRRVDPAANHRAMALLRRLGVFTCSNLLVWEPDTTLADLRANLALLRSFPDQLFNVGRTELYEGAPLTLRLADEGRLLGDYLGRDYRVADPRAELAFRIYRVACGERCYPLDGTANGATDLAYDAHLLERFLPGERSTRLREEVMGVVRRLAGSVADWLERIVGYAETAPLGPAPEVLQFTLDTARAVRAEDARFLSEMAAWRETLGRCARGEPEPLSAPADLPRKRPGRTAAVLAAAAGLLACSKGGSTSHATPDARDVAAQTLETPPAVDATSETTPTPADTGAADEVTAANESDAIVLAANPQHGQWEQCQLTSSAEAFIVEVKLEDENVAARFDRFETTDGKVEDVFVAPDGRRVHALFKPGTQRGRQRLTAIFARTEAGAGTLQRSQDFFQYGDGKATLGPDDLPEAPCGAICDPMAIPPDNLFAESGNVLFGAPWAEPTAGWATKFVFTVGLKEEVDGELSGPPEVRCTTGVISVLREGGMGMGLATGDYPEEPRPVATRDTFTISYDPRAADGSGRLDGGEHSCTVKFNLRSNGRPVVVEGTLRVVVHPDGTVQLGGTPDAATDARRQIDRTRSAAATYPELPLPLRYPVGVRCLVDYGSTLLLTADFPAARSAGATSCLWYASAGSIEPTQDGTRALWTLPEDGSPAAAVVAVQAGELDLQVASYRRG
jgi:anaerobic magnesium-protoporphyrin IX monomethyl ester cyclase